jgi:hypothetical protein
MVKSLKECAACAGGGLEEKSIYNPRGKVHDITIDRALP